MMPQPLQALPQQQPQPTLQAGPKPRCSRCLSASLDMAQTWQGFKPKCRACGAIGMTLEATDKEAGALLESLFNQK